MWMFKRRVSIMVKVRIKIRVSYPISIGIFLSQQPHVNIRILPIAMLVMGCAISVLLTTGPCSHLCIYAVRK